MGLQLGFDGSIRLMGRDEASIHEAIRATLDVYRAYCADIEPSDGPYWRIVFAILSVHSPINATFEAYRAVRLAHALGGWPGRAKLARIIGQVRASGAVLYHAQKARYILAFDAAWTADSTPFTQNGDGDTGWRDRLRRNVLGLGWAKASFAVALSKPSTSDVCCIDSHMHQLLTGRVPRNQLGKRVYLALEARVRDLADEYGVSAFTMQWLLWDAKRGISEPHSALKEAV